MAETTEAPDTALGVRTLNRLLDLELMALVADVSDADLYVDPQDGEWNVAQLLAHLGEFPAFFAHDLARWFDDPTVQVGRTHDHPVRNERIDDVTARRPGIDDLRRGMEDAFAAMAATIDRLTDEHLDRPMDNVKYGSELPAAYFARYVTGHKQSHVDQLRRTVVRARELGA